MRSAIVNTQWTQARLFSAGLADVAACQLCAATGTPSPHAPPAALVAAPAAGASVHRCLECPVVFATAVGAFAAIVDGLHYVRHRARCLLGLSSLERLCPNFALIPDHDPSHVAASCGPACPSQRNFAPCSRDQPHDNASILGDQWGLNKDWRIAFRNEMSRSSDAQSGPNLETILQRAYDAAWGRCTDAAAWTRALIPAPRQPPRVAAPMGTFRWILEPPECPIRGTFYTDGSIIDDALGDGRAVGWAFVVVDGNGKRLAAAHGATPDWISCISGAEAWGLHMASSAAFPRSRYFTDNLGCVETLRRGMKRATASHRPLARVWQKVFCTFDAESDASLVTWIPAHTSASSIGTVKRGDGLPLTRVDHDANKEADMLAKHAANARRLPISYRAEIVALDDVSTRVARSLGRMTSAANGCLSNSANDP